MSRIFVSYRRDDAADTVGRMVDRLDARFGSDVIFRDVDDIDYGADFRSRIDEALKAASIMLVVIGSKWLTVRDDRGRRLDNPEDPLRVEVASGLSSDVKVIPVLVQGARMPRKSELPAEMHGLANLNAVELRRDPDFPVDIERLIRAAVKAVPDLENVLPATTAGTQRQSIAKAPSDRPAWLGYWPIAVGAVVAVVVVAMVVLWAGSRSVIVPNVVGLERTVATTDIEALGLTVRVSEEASVDVAAGRVVSMQPAADAEVAKDTEVEIVVSRGPLIVPGLRYRLQAGAADALAAAGLGVTIRTEGSTFVPNGYVIRQDPEADTEVGPGTRVTLFVSIGPTVPDVVNLDIAEALPKVAGIVGNANVTTARIESDAVPQDHVIRTEPIAGSRALGSVTLFVSNGPPLPPPVPDISGQPEAEAVVALQGPDYEYVVSILREPSTTLREGIAIRTAPAAPAPLARGREITLFVSVGLPPPVVPEVTGLTLAEATQALTDAGLSLVLQNEASATVAAERVIRVLPETGAQVDLGADVTLVVSSGPPANTAPNAIIGGTFSGTEGRRIALDGSDSTDPDGEIVGYSWSFGDGTTGTGVAVSHAYATIGDFTVTLTTEDDDGSVSVATQVVVVSSAAVAISGGFTVPETFLADLDLGITEDPGEGADFWFQAVTSTERYIVPVNGAMMAFVGPAADFPTRTFCETVELTDNAIAIDQLVPGSHVCLLTTGNRPAGFRVETEIGVSPGALVIRWVAWDP